MGLPAARGTDEQDVGLLHEDIPKIGVDDDRIGSFFVPRIDEALVVVGYTQGEPSLGDVLPNDMLVQVGDQGFGRWD